jgi:hypothetical protein
MTAPELIDMNDRIIGHDMRCEKQQNGYDGAVIENLMTSTPMGREITIMMAIWPDGQTAASQSRMSRLVIVDGLSSPLPMASAPAK